METRTYTLASILTIALAVLAVWHYTKDNPIPPQAVEEQALPSDFVAFYQLFHADSTYQVQHIQFPLKGLISFDTIQNQEHSWNISEWILHKQIDDMNGTFTVKYRILSESLIEEQVTARGYNFDMLRRFAKLGEDYKLIYYKSMGPSQF